MKRFTIMLAIAAAAMLAAVSCTEKNTKNEECILKEPVYAAVAAKYEFTEPVVIGASTIKSIEFTESGYAIITKLVPNVKAENEYREEVEVTTYSLNENGGYQVQGLGEVKTEDQALTIGEQSYPARLTEQAPINDDTKDLCRTWVISETTLSLKGGSLGNTAIGKLFRHGKVDEMVAWARDHNVKVGEVHGYNVVDITFTKAGTFLVNFESVEPFSGHWELNGTEFTYDTPTIQDIFNNASAHGAVVPLPNGYMLTATGSAEHGGEMYEATVEITLAPAEELKN